MDRLDAGDPRFSRSEVIDQRVAQPQLPLVVLVQSADDFHQRAFSRAIISDQRGDLASLKTDGDAIEGFDAPEKLADACAADDGKSLRRIGLRAC